MLGGGSLSLEVSSLLLGEAARLLEGRTSHLFSLHNCSSVIKVVCERVNLSELVAGVFVASRTFASSRAPGSEREKRAESASECIGCRSICCKSHLFYASIKGEASKEGRRMNLSE